MSRATRGPSLLGIDARANAFSCRHRDASTTRDTAEAASVNGAATGPNFAGDRRPGERFRLAIPSGVKNQLVAETASFNSKRRAPW